MGVNARRSSSIPKSASAETVMLYFKRMREIDVRR